MSRFEVGTAAPLRALHRMPGMEGPEGELHAHDYRIEVVVRREELDERGMVCDLDVLNAALAGLAARVRDRDLEEIRPPWADAVTVEVFARWTHEQLAVAVAAEGAQMLSVRVFESDREFGGYRAPVR